MITRLTKMMAFSLAICGASCSKTNEKEAIFFPVDSLVSAQLAELSKANASIRKVAYMQGERSDTTYAPGDSVAWKKELEIVSHLEVINKPVNREYYSVKKQEVDNLFSKSFETTEEDLPVKHLTIFYSGHDRRITKLLATVTEKNSMFLGTRNIELEFDETSGAIKNYSIKGAQKMFVGDSVNYRIDAQIRL